MNFFEFLIAITNGYKTYACVGLAALFGFVMVLTSEDGGLPHRICQALCLLFTYGIIAGLLHVLSRTE